MRIPLRSFATLVLAAGVATCSETASVGTNAAAPGKGRFSLAPVFSRTAAEVLAQRSLFAGVDFDHVRVVLVRPPDETVLDTTIAFTPGAPSVTLELTVPVRAIGESFVAGVDYTSGGVVVFHGSSTVISHAPDESPPAQEIVIQYVGVGANTTRLAVSPKTVTLQAPTTSTFSVVAFDAGGSAVANVPITWSSSDPTVATITASTGVLATTGKRGTTTVTARTPTGITDNGVAIVTLPATGIILVSGGGQSGRAGGTLSLPGVVRVVASDGVGVAGVTVTFAAPAGGSVGSPSVTTDATGQASTTLTLGAALGPQSFAAAAGAFSVSIPAAATAAGDASSIVAFAGNGQVDTVRRALKLPFVVKLADRFGNAIVGATVTWARTAGAGTLSATTSVTNSDGLASINYTLGATVGTETVTATASGVGAATFTATAVTSAPSAIAAVSGSGQAGRAMQPLGAPFVVRVTDDAGGPVSGVSVTWTAVNGTFATSTTTTDAQGQSSNTMTLGGTIGPASATATAGGKSVSFTATVQPGVAAQLVFRAAPPSGVAGTPLAPAVQLELRDAAGNLTAAANAVTIALGANPGGSTLGGTLTRTSAGGVATFDDLTLNRPGVGYTLAASSAGVPNATSAPFTILVGSAATITIVAGDNQTATVNTTVPVAPSVRVADSQNNPIAGVPVTFTPVVGSGTVVPATAVPTNAQGIATLTSWTFGTAASGQTLGATGGGLSATFHGTAVGGPATKLAITTQPSATAVSAVPLATQPVVQAQDQFGNPVAAGALLVTATPSAGPATGNTATMNGATGTATFAGLTLSASGTVTLTFTAFGLQSVTSVPIAVAPGQPATLAIVAGNNQIATVNTVVSAAPSVRVSDASNNPVPGVAVTFTPGTGSGTVIPAAPVTTNAQGIATLTSWTLGTIAGPQTLVASVAGLTATFNATATGGVATKLAITRQPSGTAISAVALAIQPIIQIQDTFGNPVAAGALVITAAPSAGPATGNTATASATTGTATFTTLTLTASGTVTLTFSATGLQSVTSTAIAVAPGPPVAMAIVAGNNQADTVLAILALAPSVRVADANNNPVPGVAVTFTPGATSGAATPPTVTTNALGIATLTSWRLGTLVGTQTLAVTAAGTPGVTFTATGRVGNAARLRFNAPFPTGGTGGTILTPAIVVAVTDQSGNVVTTATDSITIRIASGTGITTAVLSGTFGRHAVNGLATFNDLVIDRPGTGYTLSASTATIGGGVTTTSPAFTMVASPNAPVISGITATLINANDPSCFDASNPSVVWALHTFTFSYSDPNGNVNLQQSNLLTLDWLFHPDNFTGGAVWPIDQSATTGTGAAGTITAGVCTPFGAETDVVYTWTVRDATNLVSNGLAITVPNPGGGVAQGLSVSRAAGIQSAKVAPKPRPKSP